MADGVHYFVWYRIAGDRSTARAAIEGALHDVLAATGVAGRVLVKRDDPQTWMEIYEQVGDGPQFERELAAAVARHDVTRHLEGGARHLEPFVAP